MCGMDEGGVVIWKLREMTLVFLVPTLELRPDYHVCSLCKEFYYQRSALGVMVIFDEEEGLRDEICTEVDNVT